MKRGLAIAGALCTVFAIASCGGRGATTRTPATSSPTPAPFVSDEEFETAVFGHPTQVSNPYFPWVPGTQLTWKGHAYDDDERVERQIEVTFTNLTKEIDGVTTVVGWERDFTDGALEEVELTFYAQADDGTVWYFGEYPEEYDGKELVKSPLWLAGLRGARPGITMQAAPTLGTPDYAEGWGGLDVDWTDRGKVDQTGVHDCVTYACYEDVVVIDEFNPDEPGRHQLKSYAPGVGGVRTGWRGSKEDEKEELQLVSIEHLDEAAMAKIRAAMLEQEARAYDRSPEVYGRTDPIRAP